MKHFSAFTDFSAALQPVADMVEPWVDGVCYVGQEPFCPADAIGSIANYYQQHGWRIQGGVAWRASSLKRDATALANGRLKPERPLSDYVTRGGVLPTGVERDTMVTLMHLEGERGDEYWLGLHNFYVITRYNPSRLYAMAVFQLGEEILGEIADVLTQGDE